MLSQLIYKVMYEAASLSEFQSKRNLNIGHCCGVSGLPFRLYDQVESIPEVSLADRTLNRRIMIQILGFGTKDMLSLSNNQPSFEKQILAWS